MPPALVTKRNRVRGVGELAAGSRSRAMNVPFTPAPSAFPKLSFTMICSGAKAVPTTTA